MVITPENRRSTTNIFLAGTIDMGKSVDWQSEVIKYLDCPEVQIANPRRVVGPKDSEEIEFQIKWELHEIQKSDAVFMNFVPGSKSPITLLELGLCLMMPKLLMVVVCPPEYARHQNVKITVGHYHRPNLRFAESLHGGIEDFLVLLRKNGTLMNNCVQIDRDSI